MLLLFIICGLISALINLCDAIFTLLVNLFGNISVGIVCGLNYVIELISFKNSNSF
jgi:hypothetical protein